MYLILQFMKQTVAEKQQHVNKLNRIAPELAKLSPGAGAQAIQAKVDDDNHRYENVKDQVNKRGEKMFDLLQRTSSVSVQLQVYCRIRIKQMSSTSPCPSHRDNFLLLWLILLGGRHRGSNLSSSPVFHILPCHPNCLSLCPPECPTYAPAIIAPATIAPLKPKATIAP